MESSFELTAVAFVHGTGGQVRVLLAIDRDGEQLFEGEPALLLEHRPGRPSEQVELEGAERIAPEAVVEVLRLVHAELAALVEGAFDETGMFDGQRMLGHSVRFATSHDHFDK